MNKHLTKRIIRVDEIDESFLKFKLTAEQRTKIPKGEVVTFRKSTQPYVEKGYRQLISRAEFNKVNPVTGTKRAASAGSKLIGIIWDDDPEWVYETDKTKSSKGEIRTEALTNKALAFQKITTEVASIFRENIEYSDDENVVIVRKVPVDILLTVALACCFTGSSDATSIANYWNKNIPFLRECFPNLDLTEISHDTVRRVFISLTEKSLQCFLESFNEWVNQEAKEETCHHFALDGQTCRSSRHIKSDAPMAVMNAVDITTKKTCVAHTMIDTKKQEPKYVPALLDRFNIQGATVSLDALSTSPEIVKAIISRGGYYLLALKSNQRKLLSAAKKIVDEAIAKDPNLDPSNSEKPLDHGRFASRDYIVLPAKDLPKDLLEKWIGLEEGCIIRVKSYTFRKNSDRNWKSQTEFRWYITCHPYDNGETSEWLIKCVRGHWGIESFHWTLDMIWSQDQMQCKYPQYLIARETLSKLAHNILVSFQKIDQEERGIAKPRSERQIGQDVGCTFESALSWFSKILKTDSN